MFVNKDLVQKICKYEALLGFKPAVIIYIFNNKTEMQTKDLFLGEFCKQFRTGDEL